MASRCETRAMIEGTNRRRITQTQFDFDRIGINFETISVSSERRVPKILEAAGIHPPVSQPLGSIAIDLSCRFTFTI